MLDFVLILQILILVNPVSSFSVLMAAYKKKMDTRKIAIDSVIVAFIIAVVMIFTGPLIFRAFGITLDSFKVAGGIVLFLLGIETIRPKEVKGNGISEVDGIISLLATPVLTGPATISFLTIKSYEIGQMELLLNVSGAFVIILAICVVFSMVINRINRTVVDIGSRIMGLFLTAVAIEMIAKGISVLLFVK